MSVFVTAAIVLIGLLGLSGGLVGLAEVFGRVHRRALSRDLVAAAENLLVAAALGRSR
jgi:hypothetical protein